MLHYEMYKFIGETLCGNGGRIAGMMGVFDLVESDRLLRMGMIS